ncbi:MAG: pentapeptide repeat-containing protein, partial [Geminicoccaceae bacterium]
MLKWLPFRVMLGKPIWIALLLSVWLGAVMQAAAQDMMKDLDLSSPDMTEAEMTVEQVIEQLEAATADQPADFTGKRLNGLNLEGLDFSGAILRAARLNNANLKGADLEGAILDQAWMLNVDLSDANLRGAKLFQAQLVGSMLDGADFSGARVASDLSKASIKGASFVGASLGADMKNQSMGLMRGVL